MHRDLPERSTALVRAFGPALQRASIGGALVAATLAGMWTFLRSGSDFTILELVVAAAIAGAVATVVGFLLVPRRLHRAFEAFSWLGRLEVDRFQVRTGGQVPSDASEIDAWLAVHPAAPSTLIPRVEILAFVGRFDDAREELSMVEPLPESAFERASLVQYIEWLETGDSGVAALRAAAVALPPDTQERRAADVTIALAEARERALRGDPDWFAPLEAVRKRLGDAPRRVVLRDTWVKAGVAFGLVGLIAAMAASLLRFLL